MVASVVFALLAAALPQSVNDLARADLAKKLDVRVSEVKVVSSEATTWPDAALGLPRLGEVVAMVQTPGRKIVLEVKKVPFLYTSSAKAVRFGGPLGLQGVSLLLLMPVPNEPNLNSDLMQISLFGTNPRRLLQAVSRFAPQPGGGIMAVRRTSRSGHSLIYLGRGDSLARMIRSAFDFGAFAADLSGKKWAVCERASLGNEWTVIVDAKPVPLPDGSRPTKLAWQGDRLFAFVEKGLYVMGPEKPVWEKSSYPFVDDAESLMLNKSESLDVKMTPNGDARVLRVWFTGDEQEVAQIKGLKVSSVRLVLGHWAFIQGERKGSPATYAVELSSGVVVPCFAGHYESMKLFPPAIAG